MLENQPLSDRKKTLETPPIDEAQFQLALRLERIFMPYAMTQRAAAYREQTGKSLDAATNGDRLRFAHYTSADAALKIIDSKRIWMRNASCMSDYREVQHGFNILQKYFLDKDRTARFSATLDACAPGVAQEAIQVFNQWWLHPQVSTRLNTYITSIEA